MSEQAYVWLSTAVGYVQAHWQIGTDISHITKEVNVHTNTRQTDRQTYTTTQLL